VKRIILYLWQLPQNLAGLFLTLLLGAERLEAQGPRGEIIVYRRYVPGNKFTRFLSGVSLGEYVILPDRACNENTIRHEYGHCVQSRRRGPLYLLTVGVPSLLGNLYGRLFHRNLTPEERSRRYYGRYPEKQADRLGGVKREYNKKAEG
jgi:hypothetical protein